MGFVSIYLPENFIHHLFIAPQYQNLGVGTALLKHAEDIITATAYLKCLTANKAAIDFYQRHAWKINHAGHSEDGDYYLMSKQKTPL